LARAEAERNPGYRHGLCSQRDRTAVTEEVEALAGRFAGEVTGAIAAEQASFAAAAEFVTRSAR